MTGDVRQRRGNSNKKTTTTTPVIHEDVDALKKTLADAVVRRESRSGGDGESLPDTPPNETAPVSSKLARVSPPKSARSADDPFTLNISVDFMAVTLFVVGLALRLYNLSAPNHVVFDEMHYGKYASLYLKRVFFFDSNPPLGKLLLAAVAFVTGFDGEFEFEKIGVEYDENVPVFALRFLPALCGTLISPAVYLILCELGVSKWTGALAGVLLLLDTAILAQSRFILLESMMILFGLLALYSVIRFRRFHSEPFSANWWTWITAASFFMGAAFCVKYLALYSCWLCCFVLLRDFWRRLADRSIESLQLVKEFVAAASLVLAIPAALYIGCFYVHLSLLTKAGVHDALMTSAFQASLEGGLSSIVQGQPQEIAHGSQITLRHTHGKTCWIHSHEHVYPVRYEDGRGSSHQQQISCYGYKDVNNWWIVKRPDNEDLAVHEPLDVIKDGDVIQLVHGMTHRALNSHDVAAPLTPHNQEVSCYIDYNISMASENEWKVDIVNTHMTGSDRWHAINSQVRFIHTTTGQALKFSMKTYPDWGFHQHEVCADKLIDQVDTVWNVEEHRYTKNDEDKKALERELYSHELIPQRPTHLSFWEKFKELQIKMLLTNQENVQNHNYASDPLEWPLLTRGIAYFISKESNAQVHLLGNVAVWYAGTASLAAYGALLAVYLLRRRRQCYDIPEAAFQQFISVGEVLLGGYLFHYAPFFFADRTLFLHHYLPAYVFKVMICSYIIYHIHHLIGNVFLGSKSARLVRVVLCAWLLLAVYVFAKFWPLCHGIAPLSADEVRELKWKETWDLIIHKP